MTTRGGRVDDDVSEELIDADAWADGTQRAVLSESAEGRVISAAFIETFGDFVSGTVRPILRDVAESGGEPQLLVNGLAQMLRDVADGIEFPPGVDAPSPRPAAPEGPSPDVPDAS